MAKVIVTAKWMLPQVEALLPGFELVGIDMHDHDGLRREGKGVRAILLIGVDPVDDALLATLPDLELVALLTAGFDGIDLDAVRARGVTVTNSGSANSGAVADLAMALMLGARRKIVEGDDRVRSGRWVTEGRRADWDHSISADTCGIVGLGNIGMEIARRMEPFGSEIAWWGPRPHDRPWPRKDSLKALAEWASLLFVVCPDMPETRRLIDREVIDALGPKGLLVNIARGAVIDEDALIAALKDGRLGAAALDVYEEEPTPAERWADVPNTLFSPHIAGGTVEAIQAMLAEAAGNIRRLHTGEPLRNVIG